MEEDLHFIEQRVGVIAFCGGLAGASRAILKGHPMLRTSLLTGMSCAMVATACFGSERIVNIMYRNFFLKNNLESAQDTVMLSHGVGGVLGGTVLGGLYNGKPLHGVLFIAPLMLLAGYGTDLYYNMRNERPGNSRDER